MSGHWDDIIEALGSRKLIMYYTTFSIKSWIPDWNDIIWATFMTSFFFLDPSDLCCIAKEMGR
ncbi:MAG: hypothetical protein ACEY3B_04460 [Wolbachia sp.]|uniref:hypothetical protein n=1 Tax=Wolbachia pipientis TaxID=955 RepID=UPI0034DAF7A4